MNVDYLVVGSGLTGSVIARALADRGREVLVLERRSHLGGNVHDSVHPSGIRMHTYGPHYFRCSSERLWKFVNRFASFYPIEIMTKSLVNGRYENWPLTRNYIDREMGVGWKTEFHGRPRNFEEACLKKMPRGIYERFVKGYTEKQWGASAASLESGLASRVQINRADDRRLKPTHRYRGLPTEGYESMMRSMLAGIPVLLNVDYLNNRDAVRARRKLIFTGPIDAYFGYDAGRLLYRGQRRTHEFVPGIAHRQPCAQVNYPGRETGETIRSIEWKYLMPSPLGAVIPGALLTHETPYTPDDPDHYEYPFPDEHNRRLYEHYRRRAATDPGLLICGRLGEYRYFDMDQAIARALKLAEGILEEG